MLRKSREEMKAASERVTNTRLKTGYSQFSPSLLQARSLVRFRPCSAPRERRVTAERCALLQRGLSSAPAVCAQPHTVHSTVTQPQGGQSLSLSLSLSLHPSALLVYSVHFLSLFVHIKPFVFLPLPSYIRHESAKVFSSLSFNSSPRSSPVLLVFPRSPETHSTSVELVHNARGAIIRSEANLTQRHNVAAATRILRLA